MEPFKTDKITQESIDKSKLYFPENEVQAEWMQKAGYRWIADNAPHKLTDLTQELTAANKAIVALSEVLSTYLECYYTDGGLNMPILSDEQIANGHKIALIYDTEKALKTHAPAIEKARGG